MRSHLNAACAALLLLTCANCSRVGHVQPGSSIPDEGTKIDASAEAVEFIPVDWRSRIRPLQTIELAANCVDLREIAGTPSGASEQGILWTCGTRPAPRFDGDYTLHWWSAAKTRLESATPLPYLHWQSDVAVVGDKPYAYFTNKFELRLLASDGVFTTLPEPTDGDVFSFRDLSPSGRHLFRLSVESSSSWQFEVIDLSSGEVVYISDEKNALYLVHEAAGGLQLVGSQKDLACEPPACAPAVIIRDITSGELYRIPVPNAVGFAVPRSYGKRQVVVDVYPPEQGRGRYVAIIDLDKRETIYSGPVSGAPPADTNICGPLRFEGDSRDLSQPLRASLEREGFLLPSGKRRAPTRCALTGDGKHLAIVAPPYVHIYAVGPAR